MELFQGDNETLSLVLKDQINGSNIESSIVNDIVAVLYLEYNKKPYVYWCLSGGSVYDRNKYVNLTAQLITLNSDGYTFNFNLESSDTENMPAGRYIIQISYNIDSAELTEGKFVTEYGALTTIRKSN